MSQMIPLGKIVYVCDDLIQDVSSRKLHIVGVFTGIRLPPDASEAYSLERICVFAQLTGGRGSAVVQVRVMDASSGDEVFGSPVYAVNFPGGHTNVTVSIRMLDCPFPSPGVYLVQLYCNDTFLDDRRLTVY